MKEYIIRFVDDGLELRLYTTSGLYIFNASIYGTVQKTFIKSSDLNEEQVKEEQQERRMDEKDTPTKNTWTANRKAVDYY